MLRYRRYRAFVVFAIIAVIAIYHFGSGTPQVDYLKQQLTFHGSKHGLTSSTSSREQDTEERIASTPSPPEDPKGKLDIAKNKPSIAWGAKFTPPPINDPGKPKQHIPPDNRPKKHDSGLNDEFGGKGPTQPAQSEGVSVKDKSLAEKLENKPSQGVQKGNEDVAPSKTSPSKDEGRVRVMPHPIPADSFEKIHLEGSGGEGRWENDQIPLDAKPILWEKQKEHFPVADASVITLPTGKAKKMPKIQADFEEETTVQRMDRLEKRGIIKENFLHAWNGYKKHAFGHDEIKPVSGKVGNPFNGWGATLVDSLDTLWMMGLKDEFEEAVEKVGEINFKTSRRADIPLFETTIRYLGGLLAAYDVSDGKYRTLLDKAAELAEILIGAFDTPNRMPDMYYQWKPDFASQAHRSGTRVVLAEIGSLAVEFTRLAQLTKEPRYYDAIARITNALEEWQDNTRLPGMWPSHLDASGCEKKYIVGPSVSQLAAGGNLKLLDTDGKPLSTAGTKAAKHGSSNKDSGLKYSDAGMTSKDAATSNRDDDELEGVEVKQPLKSDKGAPNKRPNDDSANGKDRPSGKSQATQAKLPPPKKQGKDEEEFVPLKLPDPIVFKVAESKKEKRQLKNVNEVVPMEENVRLGSEGEIPRMIPQQLSHHKHDDDGGLALTPTPIDSGEECLPQGLASQAKWGTDDFTFGSMADSTYEYLPKMHLLLNGVTDQYKKMYLKAVDVAKDHLIFRQMIPNEKREILVSGQYSITQTSGAAGDTAPVYQRRLKATGSHLTCFVGGMFAMGARLFDRKDDLEIAKKLTDGCVYAYEMTATGIMPETFNAVACDDRKTCPWNETKWWAALDPDLGKTRMENYKANVKFYQIQLEARQRAAAERGRKGSEKHKTIAQTLEDLDATANIVYEPADNLRVAHDADDEVMTVPKKAKDSAVGGSDRTSRNTEDEMLAARKKQKDTVMVGQDDYNNDEHYRIGDYELSEVRTETGLKKRQLKVATTEELTGSKKLSHDAQAAVGNAAKGEEFSADYWDQVAAAQDRYEAEQAEKQMEIAKGTYDEPDWHAPDSTVDILPPLYSPVPPLDHEHYVKKMIQEHKIPPGVASMGDKRYILRPEALESVFYMHRITASPYWRQAGWRMITSILKHTRTDLAHSAIDDVTKEEPKFMDSMESFWLGETLKYAWLLFEEEEKWSLDEWVFNTEAHPLRRTGLETTKSGNAAKSDKLLAKGSDE